MSYKRAETRYVAGHKHQAGGFWRAASSAVATRTEIEQIVSSLVVAAFKRAAKSFLCQQTSWTNFLTAERERALAAGTTTTTCRIAAPRPSHSQQQQEHHLRSRSVTQRKLLLPTKKREPQTKAHYDCVATYVSVPLLIPGLYTGISQHHPSPKQSQLQVM